ncbi:MAG: mycothiol system anti-sigma-R factor [Actinomycetaceae bacterium]|nr:mycothiol system anti-sigma-R factor [Arcanobacterium sp.]MDD7504999.1 mycothiol system anti-sigma-R factor [Actinomycetaceae bacterium]MDY6143344.1 mycothiol system anti-sigma-R factor [Arcanobacterium sp.]
MKDEMEPAKTVDDYLDELESCACHPGGVHVHNDNCSSVLDHLFELLDHEISPEEEAKLKAHAADCATCAQQIDAELKVREIVRRGCSQQAPASLHDRIFAAYKC